MKKILDIDFGIKTMYEAFVPSQMSSKLFYGLYQLKDKYEIEYYSLRQFTLKGHIGNNLKVLGHYDVIFQTYLYIQPIILLAILRKIGLFRKRKMVAISHLALRKGDSYLKRRLLKLIYGTYDKLLFHSIKNMQESIESGMIDKNKCEALLWGEDIDYIDRNCQLIQGNYFLSTGRECRDFTILIHAFNKCNNANLKLYTNRVNYDNDYSYLSSEQGMHSNIEITFVEKNNETARYLSAKTAGCLGVVIPICKKDIYYCVGLTSVIEAMAMAKPIISTRNLYSPIDIEKEGIGIFVDTEEDWTKAIKYLSSHPEEAEAMGKRARKLAESKHNIKLCSAQLQSIFDQ